MAPTGVAPLRAPDVRVHLDHLQERIAARFPTRHLLDTCTDLGRLLDQVSRGADDRHRRYRAARTVSRVVMVVVAGVTAVALVLAGHDALRGRGVSDSVDVLALAETTIADLVYAAIAAFFLWSFPERMQRSELLRLLHQLRSTAHVIDMHQLDKDPEQLRPTYTPTAASKPLGMTRDEVERYLDYCSEMLSLAGKTAALCAEVSQDPVILDAVNSIESLTVGLSRKIWQKISNLPPPVPVPVTGTVQVQPSESSTST